MLQTVVELDFRVYYWLVTRLVLNFIESQHESDCTHQVCILAGYIAQTCYCITITLQ